MVFYSHSIVTMTLSCIVSEIKQDIGGKSRFSYPLAFDASVTGVSVGILLYRLTVTNWNGVSIPDVKKTLGTCVTVSTEYQRVTDGQTDTHLATASRGKIMQTLSSEKKHHWFSCITFETNLKENFRQHS